MKRASTRSGLVGASVLLSLLAVTRLTSAADPREATVTQLVNDVQLHPREGRAHAAVINETVPDGAVVDTGLNSRTQLTFADQTLARLSANTIFNIRKGTRSLELTSGAVLLQAPKGIDAKISIAAVTAAIRGTTVIVERDSNAYLKFISLEGTARLYLKRRWGESVLIHPGQMLITNPNAKSLPNPVDIDLARLLNTSRLIVDFPPLRRQNLIAKETEKQQRAKSKRNLIDTNMVIFGKGTLVSLTNPAQMTEATRRDAVSSKPTSDAVPSSTDLGTIEMPANPSASAGESTAVDPATNTTR